MIKHEVFGAEEVFPTSLALILSSVVTARKIALFALILVIVELNYFTDRASSIEAHAGVEDLKKSFSSFLFRIVPL